MSNRIEFLIPPIEKVIQHQLELAFQILQANADAASLKRLEDISFFKEDSLRNLESLREILPDPSVQSSEKFPSIRNIKSSRVSSYITYDRKLKESNSNSIKDQQFLNNYLSLNKETKNRMLKEAMALGKKDAIQDEYVQKLEKEGKSDSEELKSFEESGYADENRSGRELNFEPMKKAKKSARKRFTQQFSPNSNLLMSVSLKKPTKSGKKLDLASTLMPHKKQKIAASDIQNLKANMAEEHFESFDGELINSNLYETPKEQEPISNDVLQRNSFAKIMQDSMLREQLEHDLKNKENNQLLSTNVASYNNFAVQPGKKKSKIHRKNFEQSGIAEVEEEDDELQTKLRASFRMIGGEVIDSEIENSSQNDVHHQNFSSNANGLDSLNVAGSGSFISKSEDIAKGYKLKINDHAAEKPKLPNQIKMINNDNLLEIEKNAEVLQKTIAMRKENFNSGFRPSIEKQTNLDALDVVSGQIKSNHFANIDSEFTKRQKSRELPTDLEKNFPKVQIADSKNIRTDQKENKMTNLGDFFGGKQTNKLNSEFPGEGASLDQSFQNKDFESPDKIQERPLVQQYIDSHKDNYFNKKDRFLEEQNNKQIEFSFENNFDSLQNFSNASFKSRGEERTMTFGKNPDNSFTPKLFDQLPSNDDPLRQKHFDKEKGSLGKVFFDIPTNRPGEISLKSPHFKSLANEHESSQQSLFKLNFAQKPNIEAFYTNAAEQKQVDLGPYGCYALTTENNFISTKNLLGIFDINSSRSISAFKSKNYQNYLTILANENFEPKLKGIIILDLLLNAFKREFLKTSIQRLKIRNLVKIDPRSEFLASLFSRISANKKLSCFVLLKNASIQKHHSSKALQELARKLKKRHFLNTLRLLEPAKKYIQPKDYQNFSLPLKIIGKMIAHLNKQREFDCFSILSLSRFKGRISRKSLALPYQSKSPLAEQESQTLKQTQSVDQAFSLASGKQTPANFASVLPDREQLGDVFYNKISTAAKKRTSLIKSPVFPLNEKDNKLANYFKFRNNINHPIQAIKAEKTSVSNPISKYASYKKVKTPVQKKGPRRHSVQTISNDLNFSKKDSNKNVANFDPFVLNQSQTNMANVMTERLSSKDSPGSETQLVNKLWQNMQRTNEDFGTKNQSENRANPMEKIIELTKQIQGQMEALNVIGSIDPDTHNEKSKELALRLQEIQYQLKLWEVNNQNMQNFKFNELQNLEKSINSMVVNLQAKITKRNSNEKETEGLLTARRYQAGNNHSLNNSQMSNGNEQNERSSSQNSIRHTSSTPKKEETSSQRQKDNRLEEIVSALNQLSQTIQERQNLENKDLIPVNDQRQGPVPDKNIKSSNPLILIEEAAAENDIQQKSLNDFALVLNFTLIRKLKASKRFSFEQLRVNADKTTEGLKAVKLFFINLLKKSIKNVLNDAKILKEKRNEKVCEIVLSLNKRYRIIMKKVIGTLRTGKLQINSTWSIRGMSADVNHKTDRLNHTQSIRKSTEFGDNRPSVPILERISQFSKTNSQGKEHEDVFFKSLENEYMQMISKTPKQT